MFDIVDDISSSIRYAGSWSQQGVSRDFDGCANILTCTLRRRINDLNIIMIPVQSTQHVLRGVASRINSIVRCSPICGSPNLRMNLLGTDISVFGTITNTTQSTSAYLIDGSDQAIFETPLVSQDLHRALLFTRRDMDPGEHTLTASFINATTPPSGVTACFSIDFLVHSHFSTPHKTNNGKHNTSGVNDADYSISNTRSRRRTSCDRQPLLTAIITLAVLLALVLAAGLALLHRYRRRRRSRTLKNAECHPSWFSSPMSTPGGMAKIVPFLQGLRSRPPSVSDAPATVNVPSVHSQSLQQERRPESTTLPPYSQLSEAGIPRPTPNSQKATIGVVAEADMPGS